jgi:sulfur carrier protein
MSTAMISLNGESYHTEASTLAELLLELSLPSQFAVALNGEFVPKARYAESLLTPGDALDLVSPVGGG